MCAICGLALGAGLVGCGSGQDTGVTRGQPHRPGAAALRRGGSDTLRLVGDRLRLVGDTQDVLDEVTGATRRLSARSVPVHETRAELKQLSARASGFAADAALELPATDPARPLILATEQGIIGAATALRGDAAASAGAETLGAVGGALLRLRVHVGRIAREVTPFDRRQITRNLATLRQASAAAAGD